MREKQDKIPHFPLVASQLRCQCGLRKEQRLTQEQLAILVGVSKPTLNAFEQGKTSIKLASALKILKSLGLD